MGKCPGWLDGKPLLGDGQEGIIRQVKGTGAKIGNSVRDTGRENGLQCQVVEPSCLGQMAEKESWGFVGRRGTSGGPRKGRGVVCSTD